MRSRFRAPRALCLALFSAVVIAFSGCTSSMQTHPPRTSIEQLLLSTAVDKALKGVELSEVEGVTVYVDASTLEAYDVEYVLGSIRALLSENGALLQDYRGSADMIVEARSGGLGMDVSRTLVGIPAIPIIIPGAGTIEFPEVALYSSNKQDSVSKLALVGYYEDGSNAFSTEPLVEKAYFHQYKFLFLLRLNFSDIPERRRY